MILYGHLKFRVKTEKNIHTEKRIIRRHSSALRQTIISNTQQGEQDEEKTTI